MNPPGSLKLRAWLAAVVIAAATCMTHAPARADDPPATPDTSHVSDPKAIEIADQVMQALGGRDRWDKLVGLRWSFEVASHDTIKSVRRHAWNKYTGWHKVSGTLRTGDPFVFITKLNSTEGKAWMANAAMEGDTLPKLMKRSNSIWINDSYWFLMPYKLRDPGVILKYAGTARDGDTLYDKLALSFEQVGDTPGDHYWVYVNRATHRVEKWEFVLQGTQPPPTPYRWEGWEEHDGLWFATIRRGEDGRIIYTRNVETVNAFPPTEFTQP